MRNKKKKIVFAGLVLLGLFLLVSIHQGMAQTDRLELEYPTIPGAQRPESVSTPLPNLLKYVYNFSILIAGLLTFFLTLWGGLRYITSANNPGKMADAREQITVALVGMLLIFGSYLVVNTINPDLTGLRVLLPALPPAEPLKPIDLSTPRELRLIELPIGTLITSEFLASSFLSTTTPDIDYANTLWPPPMTATSTYYSTDFQGALYGARLRRIHEVASTTVPVAKKLDELFGALKDLVNECNCWANCLTDTTLCTPAGGICSCRADQSPCSDAIKDKLETKIEETNHLKEAFLAFLNANSLVEDYYNAHQAEIDALADQEIRDLIQLMIEVENKGTYTPKTDPLERDVGQNLMQTFILLDALKKAKRQFNPYDQDEGYLYLMSYAEALTLQQALNVEANVTNHYILFLSGGLEEVSVRGDPATFYAIPSSNPHLPPGQSLKQKNIAWAQGPEESLDTLGTCDHLTEIPIGKALDEAIKLTERINAQLFEIFIKGYLSILRAEIAKSIAQQVKDLNCQQACIAPPFCVPLIFLGIPFSVCSYLPIPIPAPTCFIPGLLLIDQIGLLAAEALLGDPAHDIEKAFQKLDSQEPIGKDYCCPDEHGTCRNASNLLDVGRIKEREYTLKEKLVEVQRLLNMSRELVNPNKAERSKYDLLLEELIDLGLADASELRYILAQDKLDLQNCHIFYQTTGQIEEKVPTKSLFNCTISQSVYFIDRFDPQVCSPDPYLDCDYFNATTTRAKRPISCCCYDKDANQTFYNSTRFPELYHTTINIQIPDLSGGITLDNLPDLLGVLWGSSIDIGRFLGFGNNYYCCIKEYEE